MKPAARVAEPTGADQVVRRGTAADAEPLVSLLASAFQEDPVAVWIFPDARRRRAALPGFFRALYDLSLGGDGVWTTNDLGAVLLTTDSDTPEPAGYAERLDAVAGEDREALRTVLGLLDAHQPAVPHHHVAFAGVAPDRQRSGWGALLLEGFLRHCDDQGLPVYAETSSASGRALGHRYGFHPRGSAIRLPDGPTLQPMWRVPHARH
ncbi:hypothetical protein GA0074692_3394 [Micromonospora pallida]|uniref:Uncharacterized protein n=1 Tax=Micromonospora pallida TaxID=145854 RepID=A0A1C6STG7_9ACTN|nr:GNAT family N-acetyltransferase [Micromonospora pallida]SCL32748.1 hypothetical protein GA0074692_3394 [Micromonospora pallida]